MNNRELFFSHQAQTSHFPIGLEITSAEGVYLYGKDGRKYIDLISGIAVSSLGHGNRRIASAIRAQTERHLHLMVYGEFIQEPQARLAGMLSESLPHTLSSCYFTNSGTEAVEGALKLSKRFTGRENIISFNNAYHGSTQGALSVCGNEELKNAYRPLLPGVCFLRFNNIEDLKKINGSTACVIVEVVQGESGVRAASPEFLAELRKQCTAHGALLIFDEIQTGFGRTGNCFAFEHYDVIPDILCLAKSMGAGMPIGAFIASSKIMDTLAHHPPLGHITTFGGHPLSCAAAAEHLSILKEEKIIDLVPGKEKLLAEHLAHPAVKEIRSKGLLVAVEFENEEINKKIISESLERGVLTDWFLFDQKSMRIAPPLTISREEIINACGIIRDAADAVVR